MNMPGDRALLRRIAHEELKPAKGRITLAVACMAIVAVTTALSAWLLDPAIRFIFLDKDPSMLVMIPLAVIAVSLVKAIASYGHRLIMGRLGAEIVASLQSQMFRALTQTDLGWVQSRHSGSVTARFTHDAVYLRDAVTQLITSFSRDALSIVLLAGVMFYQDWQLAILALVVLLPVVVTVRRLARKTRKANIGTFAETDNLSTRVSEVLTGGRIVRAYGEEKLERAKADATINRRLTHILKAVKARSASAPFSEALTGLGIAAALFYAGHKGISGQMELNHFVSFIAAMMLTYQPVKSLANLVPLAQEGFTAADRIYGLIDTKPDITDRADARQLPSVKGALSFENVSFSYGEKVPALADISFSVAPGSRVALVGLSGAGKSTILNLVLRFFEVGSGRISLDDVDIREVTLASLRDNLALVTQDPILFDDSIAANISYGTPGLSPDDIIRVATAASADEFISALPDGYNTSVGEAGVRLSGGQRQRIAIARAMARNAPILLLDEATSALDSQSETAVQAALDQLMKGRTTLVIAHRLSTIRNADQILVVDEGRIVEQGTHNTLMAKGGLYARLYGAETPNISPVSLVQDG